MLLEPIAILERRVDFRSLVATDETAHVYSASSND